jgi:hypothetical protein
LNREEIARRIPILATALLTEKGYIAPLDLLLRLGWLTIEAHESWRFGRVPYLERVVSGNLGRLSFAMGELRKVAHQLGLRPSWTGYAAHWLKPKA